MSDTKISPKKASHSYVRPVASNEDVLSRTVTARDKALVELYVFLKYWYTTPEERNVSEPDISIPVVVNGMECYSRIFFSYDNWGLDCSVVFYDEDGDEVIVDEGGFVPFYLTQEDDLTDEREDAGQTWTKSVTDEMIFAQIEMMFEHASVTN